MYINGKLKLKKVFSNKQINIKNSQKFKTLLSPNNLSINKLKQKYIRFTKLPKTLSNKLNNKIIKEALILGLREEYQYNEAIKSTFENYLTEIISLKNQVKRNKEEVESNCEKLKTEFREKFIIVENFEKRIDLLNQEKKEIMRTNEEILSLKYEQNALLKKQFDKVQEDNNKQMEEIQKLKVKIEELTEIKENLNSELEKELAEQEKQHKELQKEFISLTKKCEYYQIEYDKFDMFPEELIKKGINLYDNTLTNELITEENLKIKLFEKKNIRDELINNKQAIQEQLGKLEEEQNELKRREKKFGKNLNVMNIKFRKRFNNINNNNNLNIKTKYMNTNSNYASTQRNKGNKRLKTVENKRNIVI
jgi:hypothetical protein